MFVILVRYDVTAQLCRPWSFAWFIKNNISSNSINGSCNIELHNELKESGEIHCPFCYRKLQDCLVKEHNLCCDMQDLINNNGMNVCRSCGVVHGYNFANKYIAFYENEGKIVRKSYMSELMKTGSNLEQNFRATYLAQLPGYQLIPSGSPRH